MNNLIPVIQIVPTKTEIGKTVKNYFEDKTKTTLEKYLTLKVLENVCKEGMKTFDRKDVIDSALKISEGDMKFNFNGAEVQITKESIKKTLEKYIYSEKLEELRKKNETKISELQIKVKAFQKEITDREVHEINSDIATKETEIVGEETIEYGIKITLPK